MLTSSLLHTFVANLSISRERLKQVSRTRKNAVAESLSVFLYDDHYTIEQEFSGGSPASLAIVFKETILLEVPVSSVQLSRARWRVTASVNITDFLTRHEAMFDEEFKQLDLTANVLPLLVAWIFPNTVSKLRGHHPNAYIGNNSSNITRSLSVLTSSNQKYRTVFWAGKAKQSHFGSHLGVQAKNFYLEARTTPSGMLRIYADRSHHHPAIPFADSVTVSGNNITITGRIHLPQKTLSELELIWKSRLTNFHLHSEVSWKIDSKWTRLDNGRNNYIFTAKAEFPQEKWHELVKGDVFDPFVRAKSPEGFQSEDIRLRRVPYLTRLFSTHSVASSSASSLALIPYFTFKTKSLSVQAEYFETNVDRYLKPSAWFVRSLKRRNRLNKPVWLIGELPYKAQDNGLKFFQWMRQNRPEIDAYYVIQRDSKERKNLEGYDNILIHGTEEHFVATLQAERFISTHHAEYLFPTRTVRFLKKLHGSRVFLQHGVMGTKWMVPNYGKKAPNFATDLFLCSSIHEKSYLISDFGYNDEEVQVTGLSRFDDLFSPDVRPIPKSILIMPTWRDWLQTVNNFVETDYFQRWYSLITSQRLENFKKQYGATVTLCLHPNMQKYTHLFQGVSANVIFQGETNVQTLLKEHECLITDYSSVGFDFSFLNRPVIYYQFDRNRFIGDFGSHLDLDAELPGYIAFDEDQVLIRVREVAANQFKQDKELYRRASKFIDNRDRNNNARVFQAVAGLKHRRRIYRRPALVEAKEVIYKWFISQSWYLPIMKGIFFVGSKLPRTNTFVFESDQGKSYSDSPRYIFEQLVELAPDAEKVWVQSTPWKLHAPRSRSIQRLSPKYYWTLSRAAVWVKNQNAPFYLTKPKKTLYIQTWHGTPLKKMQHDAVSTFGRDDEYLDRVALATSQWSVLLSPSDYASKAFRSAFRYEGEILETGYPRNDTLVLKNTPEHISELRSKLAITSDKKVVLYAPTFRDDQFTQEGRFVFNLPMDLEKFAAETEEDTLLLLRLHSLVRNKPEIPVHLQHRVKDLSGYSDIQDLLLLSDAIVTDYSSLFFDASILNKPIVFYAYDLATYRDKLRGFYLNYPEDLPGPMADNETQLWQIVTSLLNNGIDVNARALFNERFAPYEDGSAAFRVAKYILNAVKYT